MELLRQRFPKLHKIANENMEALLNLASPADKLASLRVFFTTRLKLIARDMKH